MENFRKTFDNWVSKKVDAQIIEIDKIASILDIDTKKWFKNFLIRNSRDYSGDELLKELLSNFTFDISRKFELILCKYLRPTGYNIFDEPFLSFSIDYDINHGFFLSNNNKKILKKLFTQLNINQKQELLKNKLFSYIVNQTNIKIFSKRETRLLKLKNINECYSNIE